MCKDFECESRRTKNWNIFETINCVEKCFGQKSSDFDTLYGIN